MKAARHVPHKAAYFRYTKRGQTGQPEKVSKIIGYNSSSIEVELNGVHLGTVLDDGVFLSNTPDPIEFLTWIEVTGCNLPEMKTRIHRDLVLVVPSQELAVVAFAGYMQRKLAFDQLEVTVSAPRLVTLNPNQQEAHA